MNPAGARSTCTATKSYSTARWARKKVKYRLTPEDRPADPFDFSLVLGGPLFQLLRQAHLSDDALTLVTKRIVAFATVTWLPLLALSAGEGHLLDSSVS